MPQRESVTGKYAELSRHDSPTNMFSCPVVCHDTKKPDMLFNDVIVKLLRGKNYFYLRECSIKSCRTPQRG